MTKDKRLALIKQTVESMHSASQVDKHAYLPKRRPRHGKPRPNAPFVMPRSTGPHPALPGYVFNALNRYRPG